MSKYDIYLAGGCFWGVENYFSCINGVIKTEVGYANGNKKNPTYQEVCSHATDFVECVHVVFDESIISLTFFIIKKYSLGSTKY